MRIEIEIPKEFEKHFNQDKFKDSLERVLADIEHSLKNGDCLCAGRYEHETIEMLKNALENSKPAYDPGKVTEELKKHGSRYTKKYLTPYGNNGYKDVKAISIHKAVEIVKEGGASND